MTPSANSATSGPLLGDGNPRANPFSDLLGRHGDWRYEMGVRSGETKLSENSGAPKGLVFG